MIFMMHVSRILRTWECDERRFNQTEVARLRADNQILLASTSTGSWSIGTAARFADANTLEQADGRCILVTAVQRNRCRGLVEGEQKGTCGVEVDVHAACQGKHV